MLDFTFGDTFINKDMYSEPFIFYQPSFNAIIPVYENGAAYFGIGPSWDIYSETSCQLKVEAGFRFNYGRSSSSDVYLRYDGNAFTIGASFQWSSKFMKNSKHKKVEKKEQTIQTRPSSYPKPYQSTIPYRYPTSIR